MTSPQKLCKEEVGQLSRKITELERSMESLRPEIALDIEHSRGVLSSQVCQQLDAFRSEMQRMSEDARTALSVAEQVRCSLGMCHRPFTRCTCDGTGGLDTSAVQLDCKRQGLDDADPRVCKGRDIAGGLDAAETSVTCGAADLQQVSASLTELATRLQCVELAQVSSDEQQTRLEELSQEVSKVFTSPRLCPVGKQCSEELEGRVKELEKLAASLDFVHRSELWEVLQVLVQGLPQTISDETQRRLGSLEELLPEMCLRALDEHLSHARDEEKQCQPEVPSQSSSGEVVPFEGMVEEVQARLQCLEHHAVVLQPEEFRERLWNMGAHMEKLSCEIDQLWESVRQLRVKSCEAGERSWSSPLIQAFSELETYDADEEISKIILRRMEHCGSGSASGSESGGSSTDSPRPCAPNPSSSTSLQDTIASCVRLVVPWRTASPADPMMPGGTPESVSGVAPRDLADMLRVPLSPCAEESEVSEGEI